MLLNNKVAVIYGGGGSIGGAVARGFARDGARVFLTGRTIDKLEAVAKDIRMQDGFADCAVVDALDETAVNNHLHAVIKQEGHIDISLNAISVQDVQGIPVADMQLEDFLKPVHIAMTTQFITAKAAAGHMIQHRSGVILSITATPAGMAYPLVGGFGPACSAIEGFSRNLAAELGLYGVRVICLRSAGSPDSEVFKKFMASEYALAKTAVKELEDDTMLGRLPMLADIANVAAFAASDRAAGMTGTAFNITCGTTRD